VRNGTNAYPIIPVATAPTGSTFHLAMKVPTGGLAVAGGARVASTTGAAPARTGTALTVTAN
jgi:hypothetical protein